MSIFPQLVANSLIAGSTYALVALGFNLAYGTTKFVNMAHGAVAAAGGYAAFWLIAAFGFNPWLAGFCGIAAAGLLGWALYAGIFSPMRKRRASNLALFIASLGAFTGLQALFSLAFGTEIQTPNPPAPLAGVASAFGASWSGTQAATGAAALLAFAGLWLLLTRTMFGRVLRAVSDDEEVAKVLGIETGRVIGWSFFIGSALAGLAGVLISFDTGLQPTMGLDIVLAAAVASIVGGLGNLYGGFLGAYLLAFAENFGIWRINAEWKPAITFAVLLLFLIFRPQGIMGNRQK